MFRLEEFPYYTGLKTNKVQRHYEYVFFLMWRQLILSAWNTYTHTHPTPSAAKLIYSENVRFS